MTYDNITYEREDRLALVTINRPEVLNAINPETSAELYDAFSRFRDDDDAWAAILTGAGDKAFSAGNDLKATAAASAARQRLVAAGGHPARVLRGDHQGLRLPQAADRGGQRLCHGRRVRAGAGL